MRGPAPYLMIGSVDYACDCGIGRLSTKEKEEKRFDVILLHLLSWTRMGCCIHHRVAGLSVYMNGMPPPPPPPCVV